jgi:hypothetical protein
VNAGMYGVTASGLYSTNGQSGYAVSYVDGGLVITPKSVTLSGAAVAGKVYDGATVAAISGTLSGVLAGDLANVSSTVNGTYASKNAGNNIAVTTNATLGGSAGGNYALVPLNGLTGNISKATISGVSGIVAGNKVYDGNTSASLNTAGASFTGMVGGDSLSVSGASGSFGDKNAANGKSVSISGIALGGTDAGNYNLTSSTASSTADIGKASITGVTGIVAGNKVYDGTTAASLNTAGASLTGMVGGDNLSVSGASGSFADKNAASGKTVSISGIALGGTDAGNYNLSSSTASSTADIAKASISGVTGIVAGNKVYDGSVAASLNTAGASLTGMVGGDSLSVSGASGSFADKNAGSGKTVNISGIALGGTDAGNYTLASSTVTGTANISKATISGVNGIVAGNKVYDGSVAASLDTAGATFAGMVGGDSLSVSGASGSFGDKNAANGKTVSISGIALGGTDAGNYNLTTTTASSSADISKATIASVSGLVAANKVYDGSTAASLNTAGAAFSGMAGGDNLTVSNAIGTFSDKNAGNGKVVNVSGIVLGGTDAGNYNLGSDMASSNANISAKALTLTGLTGNNKVYDGTANANLAGGTLNGLVNSETLAFTVQGASYSDKNAGTGKVITVSGMSLSDGSGLASNYTLSALGGMTGDIAKATISSISGLSALDKIYNGNLNVSLSPSLAVINGKIAGDDVQLFSANGSFTDKNVGSNKAVNIINITLAGSDLGNYNFTNNAATATASITPRAVTLSGVTAGNKIYDGTTAAVLSGGSLSGMVSGETLGFSGGVGSFSDKNAGTGKLVIISGTALQDGTGLASNYAFTSPANVNADISKATISGVTNVGVNNKTYDGLADATLTGAATFNGKIGNDNLTLAGSSAFSDKNAGTGKTVAVSGITLGGADAGNYNLPSTNASSTADIGKADISSVTNMGVNNKIYDGLTTATLNGAATFNGKVSGDTLTVAGSGAFGDKNAGTGKTVTVSGITLGGADAGNYNLLSNASSGTADIGKATISSVTGVGVNNKTYDGLTTATLNGVATFNGKLSGDTLTLAGSSAFSDKNVAAGKVVAINGITLGGADAGNYILGSNTSSGTADITPKSLTVTGQVAGDKVYDGNAVAQLTGGSLIGLVGSETLAIGGQTAAFGDKNAGNAKAVTVSGTTLLDGSGSAGNYTVSNPTGLTASITPATISAIAGVVAANKVYDGGTAASLNLAGASFNGMVAGDALSLGSGPVLGTFSDKNAALGKTVAISGLGLAGADAGNYVLASSLASTTATITPAALTVSASGVNKVYDATTNAAVSLRDNRIGNDQLSIASNGASFSDKNAGVGKTVMVAGISLSGTDAGNYVVNTSASTTATISQAALTVKVDNSEKDQGRVNPDFSAGYSGLLGGDTVAAEVSGNLAFSTPATTASAAGNYLVSASGQASNNYALNYVEGVLKVKPTEALQSAVASVIAAVAVAPSQGNMVQADMIVSGESAPGKPAATQEAPREGDTGNAGSAPVVQLASNVVSNVLPGLRLSVVDSGLRLPTEAGGNTRQESQ